MSQPKHPGYQRVSLEGRNEISKERGGGGGEIASMSYGLVNTMRKLMINWVKNITLTNYQET